MLSLGNKMIRSIGLVLGLAAYVLPESAPWGLYGALIASILTVSNTEEGSRLLTRIVLPLAIALSVITLSISASLGIALAASVILLANRNDAKFVAAILLLQTSIVASIDSIISSHLQGYGLETAAPAIVAIIVIFIASSKFGKFAIVAMLFSLITTKLGVAYVATPLQLQLLAGAPILLYGFLIGVLEETETKRTGVVAGVSFSLLILCLVFGWLKFPPKTPVERFVLIQQNTSAPEAQYYRSYTSALNYAGLGFKETMDLKSIPEKSLVLIPWLSIPLTSGDEASELAELRRLAQKRNWSVVLVGEHDNMGGVADRINQIVGRPILNDDLSVPPKNSDSSGSLRVGGFQGWPPSYMFNRGATVGVAGIYDRILLEADGWWAEKNIHEWLWVGDYLWQPSDRNGRLPLAASFEDDGARWVVVGDSTPFLNTQLLSNPDSASRILEMVSLWPNFLRDFLLIVLSISAILVGGSPTRILVLLLLGLAAAFVHLNNSEGNRTVLHSLNLTAFSEKNFNSALLDVPQLMNADWNLVRLGKPISGQLSHRIGKTVLFAHVDKTARIGDVTLANCRRLGNIQGTVDAYLMDAQACSVTGDAEVLIGDPEGAAGVYVNVGGTPLIVILDTSFLGQKAPKQNSEWLMRVIDTIERNNGSKQ